MTIARALPWALAVMMASALPAASFADGNAPPSTRPWLDVKLPAPPAAGAPTARATFVLRDDPTRAAGFAGFRVSVGGAAPALVPTGQHGDFAVAASPTEPLRVEIGASHLLVHVHAGETFDVREGHDGGWVAVIGSRMRENAPRQLTLCGPAVKPPGECPAGYEWTHVFPGDPVCKVTGDDAFKCVQASRVRSRGPVGGRAEVTSASASGRFDDMTTLPLAPRPLAARALGAWVFVEISSEVMPRVRLGDAEAMLVIGPGESYEVWLDAQGRVASAQVTAK